MAKKRFASSARARQAAKSAKHTPDSRIDFSDIAESTDEELRRARRLAAKQSKPYQTFIHELLERAAKKRVA